MKLVLLFGAVLCAGICQARVRPSVRVVKLQRDDKWSRLNSNRVPKDFIVNNELASSSESRSSSDEETAPSTPSRQSTDLCDECKTLAAKFKEALDDPAKMAEMQAELKIMCNFLSGVYQTACVNIANDLPFVLHQLEPYLGDPTALCQKLHLCSAGKIARNVQKLVYLTLKQKYAQATKREHANSLPCDECLFAVNELKAELEDPQTQTDFKQALTKVCGRLGSLKQQCIDVVNNFVPQLFQQLEQYLSDPNAICKQIGLCQSNSGEQLLEIQATPLLDARALNRRRDEPDDEQNELDEPMDALRTLRAMFSRLRLRNERIQCITCEFAFNEVVQYLEQNSTLDEMVATIRKACAVLPGEAEEQCLDFMTQYGRAALIVAIDQLQPDRVCKDLHFCSGQELRELQNMPTELKETAQCEACKSAVYVLSYEFQQPEVKRDLKQLVQNACNYFPQSFQSECETLSDQYVDELVTVLSNLKADDVCPAIHMCPQVTLDGLLSPADTLIV